MNRCRPETYIPEWMTNEKTTMIQKKKKKKKRKKKTQQLQTRNVPTDDMANINGKI